MYHNLSYYSQRQRPALHAVRMEHLLRGVRPQGEQLPGNEETSEAKVGKKLENPWDNPIYYAINAFNAVCQNPQTLSLITH